MATVLDPACESRLPVLPAVFSREDRDKLGWEFGLGPRCAGVWDWGRAEVLGAGGRAAVRSAGLASRLCVLTATGPACRAGRGPAGADLPGRPGLDRGWEPPVGVPARSPDLAGTGDTQNLVITQACVTFKSPSYLTHTHEMWVFSQMFSGEGSYLFLSR